VKEFLADPATLEQRVTLSEGNIELMKGWAQADGYSGVAKFLSFIGNIASVNTRGMIRYLAY
jgi:hypothetical protein